MRANERESSGPSTPVRRGCEGDSAQLRQDLYYRRCGSVVCLPPLRDRTDDIPLLVEHYVSTSASALTRVRRDRAA